MKDTNVLNIRERRATICRNTTAAAGAQAAEQTSHQDQKQSWSRRQQEAPTSMISVCACFVQKAWGGVVTLTATKLFGFRSSDGVCSSLQATKLKQNRNKINKVEMDLKNQTSVSSLFQTQPKKVKEVKPTQRNEMIALDCCYREETF